MRHDIVKSSDDGKVCEMRASVFGGNAPQDARTAEAVAEDGVLKGGANTKNVIEAKKRECRAVGIPDHRDAFRARIRDGGCDVRLNRLPYAQKAAMRQKTRRLLPRACLGRKIEIVFPVDRAFRMREIDPQPISLPRKAEISAVFDLGVAASQTGFKHG